MTLQYQLEIEVTADDIESGERGDCCECPIAIAVQRIVGPMCRVIVGASISIQPVSEPAVNYLMPMEAHYFIRSFDNYQDVSPIKFIAEREI